jgi:hypothetical protein
MLKSTNTLLKMSCEKYAVAESESEDCPVRLRESLPSFGRLLDSLVAKGDLRGVIGTKVTANTFTQMRLVRHALAQIEAAK